jgi:hypothetical protein
VQVDLLSAFRLAENPLVQRSPGICLNREGQTVPDTAFRLTKKAVISVPTATVFPGDMDSFYPMPVNNCYVLPAFFPPGDQSAHKVLF